MDEIVKKAKYAAYIPYMKGSEWVVADYYGGRQDLSKRIIALMEKKKPADRGKVTIYSYGKKDGALYFESSKKSGGEYIYETKNTYQTLYKNGSLKQYREKAGRK